MTKKEEKLLKRISDLKTEIGLATVAINTMKLKLESLKEQLQLTRIGQLELYKCEES